MSIRSVFSGPFFRAVAGPPAKNVNEECAGNAGSLEAERCRLKRKGSMRHAITAPDRCPFAPWNRQNSRGSHSGVSFRLGNAQPIGFSDPWLINCSACTVPGVTFLALRDLTNLTGDR